MRKLRILLLVPEYPPDTIGGGAVVFEALHREYSARHQVKVVSGSTGAAADAQMDIANHVIRVPEVPLPRRLRYLATTMPPTAAGLLRLFRNIREVDVVHAHGFGFPVVDIGIRLAARRRIPVLQTLHGHPVSQTKRGAVIKSAFRLYRDFSGAPALHQAQGHTAVSDAVSDLYLRKYRLRLTTLSNGVDLPDEADWPEFDSLLQNGQPLVLAVGRLEWIKGMETLIHALALIRQEVCPQVVFIGADHGAGRSLRELAHDIGVGGLCHFVGGQSRARVVHAYRKAQACVVASHTEAFPAVPLEAMLAGTALIVSRLPGVEGYAVEGVNCMMFKAGDERELATKLRRLLCDAQLRDALVTAGLATAARFKWSNVARQYEFLLAQLICPTDPGKC